MIKAASEDRAEGKSGASGVGGSVAAASNESGIELIAESIAHGGDAIAHLGGAGGQVVFLRGAAPGDRVLAQIFQPRNGADASEHSRSFLRGRTLRVLEAGPQQTKPPCPIVEQCGGCPIQHLTIDAQLSAKESLARDALVRIGGLAEAASHIEPIARSPQAFGYRRRARMHRAAGDAWGFAARDLSLAPESRAEKRGQSRAQIVAVDRCLLFEPALQELADAVRPVIAELDIPEAIDLGLLVDKQGRGAIDLRTESAPTSRLRHRVEQLVRRVRQLRGATVGPLGETTSIGEPVLADAPDANRSFRLRARPDLFAQANRGAVSILQSTALEFLGRAVQGRVLELFAGAGTLTLPLLAAGARAVIGVEEAGPSLGLLRKSADEAGLSGAVSQAASAASPGSVSAAAASRAMGSAGAEREPRLQLIAGDAAQITASLRASERGRLDAILLDPPRTGASAAVRAAAELLAPRIVYVSCDAPTLGRDAKQLAAAGYRLTRARPIDLFPQTAHFEIVALFERSP